MLLGQFQTWCPLAEYSQSEANRNKTIYQIPMVIFRRSLHGWSQCRQQLTSMKRELAQSWASSKSHPCLDTQLYAFVLTCGTTGSPCWTTHREQGSSRDMQNLQKLWWLFNLIWELEQQASYQCLQLLKCLASKQASERNNRFCSAEPQKPYHTYETHTHIYTHHLNTFTK